MKPLRLKMQAFGSYGKETTIDFEKVNQNLFLITGDTGAGKTTIFDAIVFALYGEASSSLNKKEGVVLQSQYVDFDSEPYVELVFSEGRDEKREIYTVRRVPRHLKTITRGANKGKPKENTGSVSLIMPDGMEYPSKETDRKLQEIVGLTKSQFMQVAMIAQGEFMDLLRAKSDDKKVIFRKLFNTEMYQDIVTELGNRKRAKEKEIAVLKTQCQGEVSRIRIPETYESETLKQLKKQLEEGEMTRLTDLLEEVEKLCDWLEKYTDLAEKDYRKSVENRDKKRELYTKAEALLKWFDQLETAEQKLQECADDEAKIVKTTALISRIRNAYEIRETGVLLNDAERRLTELEQSLKTQEKQLPILEETRKTAENAEEQKKLICDQELQNCSKISEKVQKALELFEQIKRLHTQAEVDRKNCALATENTKKVRKQQEALENWKQQLAEELNNLQRSARLLVKIREALQNMEKQKKQLQDTYDECTEKEKAAVEKLAGSEAALENVKGSVEFKTEEEARAALLQAESSKNQAEEVYQKVLSEAKKAANAQKQAETLISRYQQEIPNQKKCVEDRKTSYTEVMEIKQMTESEWKELVETYSREAAEEFQKTVNAYYEKKSVALAQKDSAESAIGEEQKPVLEEIQKEREAAETEYQEKEKIYNQLRMDNRDDREVFDALSGRLEERKTIVEEHARIDTLYRMTSGNVSGSRMDLETYVQRYYLEHILYAANRRFQEMSAGQFELRMYDLEKAGEGKNRGLDLMVYSTVTGKEREVRTLSGGESFMAALSLALGMADQIQQSSAAINLDMMFIDEGFGSLDEHSRNQAVRVLQEMAEGSRLIGIISHVSELKQEIEDQLLVNKDENGSHVKWQIS